MDADSAPPRLLVLPPLIEAVDAWRSAPGSEQYEAVRAALDDVATQLGVVVGRLRVSAPPLPDLDLDLGSGIGGRELTLRAPGHELPIGHLRIAGRREQSANLARALELVFITAQARAQVERTSRQLGALDQAVRGISDVLDVDRVLQVIADQVRQLVDAQYAAIGIVDEAGAIERFITSGITDDERQRIGDPPRGRGLLGLIIRQGRTYRVADIAAHPQRHGFPPNHPEMRSFLGTPIVAKGEPVGRLYLTNKLGAAEFSEDDAGLVEMFALHAGIAIENARLHDMVRRLAVVDERERISRDLHDSVIQAIYAQTLALDDVPDLVTHAPDEARQRVDTAIDALHAVIRDIRNFIFGLRPVLMEGGGLEGGLEQLAREVQRNGIEVEVSVDDPAGRIAGLRMEAIAELLAISREALSNIARHAGAASAHVAVGASVDGLRLEISDDGRGFDVDRGGDPGHHGLGNMRARSRALDATFEIASTAELGTRIIVAVPLPPGSNEEER